MNQNHTKEPWFVTLLDNDKVMPSTTIYSKTKTGGKFFIGKMDRAHDASRAVACVGACKGMEDPFIAIAALKQALVDLVINADEDMPHYMRTEHFTESLNCAREVLKTNGEKLP